MQGSYKLPLLGKDFFGAWWAPCSHAGRSHRKVRVVPGLCAAQSLSIMQGCELHNPSVTQGYTVDLNKAVKYKKMWTFYQYQSALEQE